MASNSCYSTLLRAINTRPLVCFYSFKYPIARAFSHNRLKYSPINQKSCDFGLGIRRFTHNRSVQALAFKETELTENPYKEEEEEDAMTIKPSVKVADGKLTVKNRTILTGVPDEVISTSGSESGPADGVFLGADFSEEKSRHVIRLGTLRSVRFMACFRFKLWWMSQRMGDRGSEVPLETQFLLLETAENGGGADAGEVAYTVFLPLIEGPFRACLQGNPTDDGLELCLESGDAAVTASSFHRSVLVRCGADPFETVAEAVRVAKLHLKTFRQRHEKSLPAIVDLFGWCTWDAFYQDVSQEGVEAGIRSLASGGIPAKFVIVDDGWQSVSSDENENENEHLRLTKIYENSKFRMKSMVETAKNELNVKHVYVWHAIIGYWGGVRPGESGSEMRFAEVPQAVVENEPGWKTDKMAVGGLGLVDPRKVGKFYDEMHSYLAGVGVEGVKVDVQSILETLGAGLGGRVELTRRYHNALEASVARNFPDNGCIACMSHNTDSLYCSKQTAIVRASDDFFPRDPMSHTIHIGAVAYNSVFLGEFMQPDWDMFHSLHPAGEYHASARAISGGPIYVSDAPGNHDFELLKKLVLPDGSVLRPLLPGRPTQDCLFSDPTRDGISLLKIWNMNKHTGVLGIYNCQGAAWSSTEKKSAFHNSPEGPISGNIRGCDVHLISEVAAGPESWNGDCAVFRFRSGELAKLTCGDTIPITLKVLEQEIFTITPVKVLGPLGAEFAPLGLVNMYNSGGAIVGLRYGANVVDIEVRGCGKFGAYCSAKPSRCVVGSNVVDFEYDSACGLVAFELENMPEEGTFHHVKIEL